MDKKEFDHRVDLNGGFDRVIGEWRIIDIHAIPEIIEEYHELDFYCNKKDIVILLRIRNRENEKFEIVNSSDITYWISELPTDTINNDFILKVLNRF